MAKQTKPVWYGVAAVAVGTGIFFLATNKGRLFKKGMHSLQALLGDAPAPAPAVAPTPRSAAFEDRTPTGDNGHGRGVVATDPPADDAGSGFATHADAPGPQG